MTLLNGSRCSVGLVASMGDKTTDPFISMGWDQLTQMAAFPVTSLRQVGETITHIHASHQQAGWSQAIP